ncbi:MAG: AmmeMemoRadiSam system protein B, partial [Nanoarchaeota archaeon]|nr:AmmeMemoRadiSam system protein B [Nanoarchaeota archaeon]
CFTGKRGPGVLPGKRKGMIKGIIAPHAGYSFSGPCAAWSYKALGESEMPDLYIILGPNHHSSASGISVESMELPFGTLRADQPFARELEKKGTLKVDEEIHKAEHSVEVQLPFIQFVDEKQIEKIKVLQILVGQDLDLAKAALDIKETMMDFGKKVVFIASSDFTHYGPNYHYMPFIEDVQKNIYEMDRQAIEFILNGDEAGFLKFVEEKEMTVCGFLPIALLLKVLRHPKATLDAYYTSGDVAENYRNSVSYASIVFR